MKNVIIDTDLGCDCDDATAIALANILHKHGKLNILAYTHSMNQDVGPIAIDAINNYYGLKIDVAKGITKGKFQDKMEKLAIPMATKYGNHNLKIHNQNDLVFNKIKSLPKKSVSYISIGGLSNLKEILMENRELFEEKIDRVFVMAGCFDCEENDLFKDEGEFNIISDLEAAIYVLNNNFNFEVLLLDFNEGKDVLTGLPFHDDLANPAKLAFDLFGSITRASWDPLTILALTHDEFFEFSNLGSITIDQKGRSSFKEGPGNKRLIRKKISDLEITNIIDNILFKK